MKKDIVVLGGGTAGWITAIYAKKIFPEHNVTVVHSKEIGILGAGEGSTPALISFFDFIGIPVSSLIQFTSSTIKNGIKFTNWSDDNNFYYHGFDGNSQQIHRYKLNEFKNMHEFPDVSVSDFINLNNYKNTKDYDFVEQVSEKNKVPFCFNENIYYVNNQIYNLDSYSAFSIHFDASKIADFLLKFGQEIGINIVEGEMRNVNNDEHGNITSLVLKNNKKIKVDFIFDCSGFARLLIGKHFASEWKSASKSLPMKKAIPFFLDIDKENIPSYTEAIAMNYGWTWKIPLQHRYGCGYVYDSDFISDDNAFDEAEKLVGHKIESPRTLTFNPGFYEEAWINNCLSVGLSSGFVEPLEATSIWQSLYILKKFFSKKDHIFNISNKHLKAFNETYRQSYYEIIEFLYLHYMTDKTKNNFWKDFTKNNLMPESLKEKMFFIQESMLTRSECGNLFAPTSYYTVSNGTNILNKNNIKAIYEVHGLKDLFDLQSKQNDVKKMLSNRMLSHSEFLKYLGGLND